MILKKKFTLRSGNSPLPFDFTKGRDYSKKMEASNDDPKNEANKPVKGSEVNLDKSSEFSGKKDKEKSKSKFDFNTKGKSKKEMEAIKKQRQAVVEGRGTPTVGVGGKELTGINKKIVNTIVGTVSPDNALEALGMLGGSAVINRMKNLGSKAYQALKSVKTAKTLKG